MSEIIIEETPKTSKVRNFIKKITPTKSQLKAAAAGAGVALVAAAVAIPFAFKRQDEEDFDDEFATDELESLDTPED